MLPINPNPSPNRPLKLTPLPAPMRQLRVISVMGLTMFFAAIFVFSDVSAMPTGNTSTDTASTGNASTDTATAEKLAKTGSAQPRPADQEPAREFYELRIYKIYDYETQQIADDFLRDALLPALGRQGIKNIGVFHDLKNENDHSIFVVIPYSNLDLFSDSNAKLVEDQVFQNAAKPYFDRPAKDGIFDRIESRLLKSFRSIPKMELPQSSLDRSPRIFELRLYESHTEERARRKVEMFNQGETQLMRDVQLGPVFFGETLIGPDVPNLIYMLSATDEKAHADHWKTFQTSERWKAMKDLPKYQDTVSKIKKWYLAPTNYSQF